MIISPAIDLLDGQAVRLRQGDYEQVTVYEKDPVALAKRFKQDGASRIHLVDLDGAREGVPYNRDIIVKIAAIEGLTVEVGGGIRDRETAEFYLNNGVDYVIVGSMAINDEAVLKGLLKEYGERIIVSIDAKDGMVATEGWRKESKIHSLTLIRTLSGWGVKTVVYTDIAKDGMMEGPNHKVYRKLSQEADVRIIASGGVSSVQDLEELETHHLYGAIVGRALYEDAIDLKAVFE